MKTTGWILFILAIVSVGLGVVVYYGLMPTPLFQVIWLSPAGFLRVSNTLLLITITLYLLNKWE